MLTIAWRMRSRGSSGGTSPAHLPRHAQRAAVDSLLGLRPQGVSTVDRGNELVRLHAGRLDIRGPRGISSRQAKAGGTSDESDTGENAQDCQHVEAVKNDHPWS